MDRFQRLKQIRGGLVRRLLVTGGDGFIGRNFVKAALQSGWIVRSYDLVDSHSFNHPSFEYICGDILDLENMSLAVKDCIAVVHLAAQVSVQRSIDEPDETMNINVQGTANVIKACLEHQVERLLVASSAAVYGNQEIFPLSEEFGGQNLSPYAESKWNNEEQVIRARKDGLNAIALRFFNVYGPGQLINQGYTAVIPKFITLMCNNKQPIVNGNGSHSRDFIHIDDLNKALLELLDFSWSDSLLPAYNLATQKEISLLKLVEAVNHSLLQMKVIDKEIQPQFTHERNGDVVRSIGSIKHICSILNWSPDTDFQNAITELVELELRKESQEN